MIDLRRERPVSLRKLCKVLEVNRRTVERWFGLGLERVKIGGKVYTSWAAVNRFAVQVDEPIRGERYRDRYHDKSQTEAEVYLAIVGVSEPDPPGAKDASLCLMPDCMRVAEIRGQCRHCARASQKFISSHETTWGYLESKGFALPPTKQG